MDCDAQIRAIRLFNEKVEKLASLSFTKAIMAAPHSYTLSYHEGQGAQAVRSGPNREAIDAFVLTFRFFCQDNEPTSLANMATLYSSAPVSPALKGKFDSARAFVNTYLDKTSFITYNEDHLTRRRIMQVFVYGGLAHANRENKKVFDEWAAMPLVFPLLENEFVAILCQILSVLLFVRDLNDEALGQLPAQPRGCFS